jgi:hypothetical protein
LGSSFLGSSAFLGSTFLELAEAPPLGLDTESDFLEAAPAVVSLPAMFTFVVSLTLCFSL